MARDVHKVLLQIIVMQGRTTQDEAELLLKGLDTGSISEGCVGHMTRGVC